MPRILSTLRVKHLLEIEHDCQVADLLGITKVAVCKWRNVVPPGRVAQLQDMFPGYFDWYTADREARHYVPSRPVRRSINRGGL